MRKQTPSWSIRGRLSIPVKDTNPGPGTYSPQKRSKSPNYSLGRSGRPPIGSDGSQMPGPGEYKTAMKLSKGPKFGQSHRKDSTRRESPGPGTYTVSGKTSGPIFTLKPRLSSLKIYENPGPAEYYPKNHFRWNSLPKWVMGQSHRKSVTANGVPGPGTYYNDYTNQGPKWRFGSSRRSSVRTEHSPGPGAYDRD